MENYYIAAFRSRNDTLDFLDIVRRQGIDAYAINTPKEAYVGCGLSVKISEYDFEKVKPLIKSTGLSTFAGFFRVSFYGRRMSVTLVI